MHITNAIPTPHRTSHSIALFIAAIVNRQVKQSNEIESTPEPPQHRRPCRTLHEAYCVLLCNVYSIRQHWLVVLFSENRRWWRWWYAIGFEWMERLHRLGVKGVWGEGYSDCHAPCIIIGPLPGRIASVLAVVEEKFKFHIMPMLWLSRTDCGLRSGSPDELPLRCKEHAFSKAS